MQNIFNKEKSLTLIFVIIFLLVFYETFATLFTIWTSFGRGYSHGLLLLAICIYLSIDAYSNNKQAQFYSANSYILLFITLLLCLTWALASLTGTAIVQQLVLPVIFLSSSATLFGIKRTRFLVFPVLLIYLGLPFWDITNPFLQMLTVKVVQHMVNSTGLVAYIYGTYIEIPSGTFHVAQSCAGMRYMLVALTITTLHGYLSFQALAPRLAMISIGLSLSLLANWIRVYTIIYIGYKTQMQSSIVTDHETLGWIVFGIVLAPILFITPILARFDKPHTANKEKNKLSIPAIQHAPTALSLCICLLAIAGISKIPLFLSVESDFTLPPQKFSSWEFKKASNTWQALFKNPTKEINYEYVTTFHQKISLYIAHYVSQNEGAELVSDSNKMLPMGWELMNSGEMRLSNDEIVRTAVIRNKTTTKYMAYWYKIGKKRTSKNINAKIFLILSLLSGNTSGNFISVSTACNDVSLCDKSEELRVFIDNLKELYDEI